MLLPGKFHGRRSLVGYSPQTHKELDMTEQLPPTSKKKKKRTNLEFKEFAQNCTVIKGWSQNSTPGTMSAAAAAAKSLQSCLTLRPHRQQPTRLRHPWDSPDKNTGVGCHLLLQCMKVKSESEVTELCPTLRDPMDCSPLCLQSRQTRK